MLFPYLFLSFVIASLLAIYVWILLDPKSFFQSPKPKRTNAKRKRKKKKRKSKIRL